MNRRWPAILIAVAALTAIAAFVWLARGPSGRRGELPPSAAPAPPADAAPAPAAANGGETAEHWTATLFLPTVEDRLAPREVEIASGGTAVERARAVIESLLATRPETPLVAPFPPTVALGKLLLSDDGTAYVDLRPASAEEEPPASGSQVELLAVYSVVHSLLRNVAEAHRVVLLWSGTQRVSLSGHVDTGHPLTLRPELEAR